VLELSLNPEQNSYNQPQRLYRREGMTKEYLGAFKGADRLTGVQNYQVRGEQEEPFYNI
jgi:hypothetical protein